MKKRLLFVCLGNICRSPLAEALMRQMQTEFGLDFELDSAGTSGYHIGELPDARTRANALQKRTGHFVFKGQAICKARPSGF